MQEKPVQWWRNLSKCPACGGHSRTYIFGRFDEEPGCLEVRCTGCNTHYPVMTYYETPWWRQWFGPRFIKEKEPDKMLPPVTIGPYR